MALLKETSPKERAEILIDNLTENVCSDSFDYKEQEGMVKDHLRKIKLYIQEVNEIPLQVQQQFPGLSLLIDERVRQVEEEGWDTEHDQQHDPEHLARAAAAYLLPEDYRDSRSLNVSIWRWLWPFAYKWFKPKDYFQDLVRGAALSLAALDRYLRDKENFDIPGDETE